MGGAVHIDVRLHADVDVRERLAATFGLAGDLPEQADTGCGLRVPFVMTSTLPDAVTCAACRDFGHRRFLELAAYVDQVGRAPGTGRDVVEMAVRAGRRYREIARRFAEPAG